MVLGGGIQFQERQAGVYNIELVSDEQLLHRHHIPRFIQSINQSINQPIQTSRDTKDGLSIANGSEARVDLPNTISAMVFKEKKAKGGNTVTKKQEPSH